MKSNKDFFKQKFILAVSMLSALFLVLFIFLINISIVSAATLVSSSAPASVNLGSGFQIKCDYEIIK